VDFPENLMSGCHKIDEFVEKVFKFNQPNLIDTVSSTSILSPKNSSCDIINEIAVRKFPG
jgi:hypothetical protein